MAAKRNLDRWAPWIFLAVLLVVWEFGVRTFRIDEFVLPTASASFRALYDNFWPIMKNTWPTFWTTMVGFGIGIVVGVLIGVIIGSSRLMYNGLYPLLVAFNAVPKAAFVPILVVWFGIGVVPAMLTAFLICFFPITVNVATGLATIEPELEDVLRALGASRADVLLKVGGAYTGDVFQSALFENPGHGNHWIALTLVGVESNRAALGARIAPLAAATPCGRSIRPSRRRVRGRTPTWRVRWCRRAARSSRPWTTTSTHPRPSPRSSDA